MIYVVIGHRGVGKTKFVERIRQYYNERQQLVHTFDLDQEIELQTQKSILEIFNQQGEAAFRELETQVLGEVLGRARQLRGSVFIAVGAGYQGSFPAGVNVWWLRRPSDQTGRIFLNRPVLDPQLSPLTEFAERRAEREERFRRLYHREFMLSEGWDKPSPYEAALVGLRPANLGTTVTLMKEQALHPIRREDFLQSALQLGVKWVELRNDLLDEDTIRRVVEDLPREKVLISFRNKNFTPEFLTWAAAFPTDWALELGPSPLTHNFIMSLHTRLNEETIDDAAERLLAHPAEQYKLAVPARDFIELWAGHRFYTADPKKRSFLPQAATPEQAGRWQWYRLVWGRLMPIAFARFGEGSSPEQPTVFEFLRWNTQAQKFAAVLGWPVAQSHTPAEQHAFFVGQDADVVSLPVPEAEMNSFTLSVLERLGFCAFAVTAPLKNKARELCTSVDKIAAELGAVNTMVATEKGWSGINTDFAGMRTVLSALDLSQDVAVWGGGGTRTTLQKLLPQAQFFSARYGHQLSGERLRADQMLDYRPQILVWALGRSRMATGQWPAPHWRPELVFDLNYSEDSPGLEYAKRVGARYISGQAFFKAQAALQRVFWATAWAPKEKTKTAGFQLECE